LDDFPFTGRGAETPHEHQFVKTFGKAIDSGLAVLRLVPDGEYNPVQMFTPLQAVFDELRHMNSKKSSMELSLDEISPVLCSVSKSVVSMPGVLQSEGSVFLMLLCQLHSYLL
jgi:hypothetical protein